MGPAILLIDDDRADITLVTQAIAMTDPAVQAIPVRTLDDALEALETEDLRLVLLDLNMPGTSGFEVLEQLRRHERSHSLPVVVFTTSAAQTDVDKAYKGGANGFITKPADLVGTLAMARQLIDFWIHCAAPWRP